MRDPEHARHTPTHATRLVRPAPLEALLARSDRLPDEVYEPLRLHLEAVADGFREMSRRLEVTVRTDLAPLLDTLGHFEDVEALSPDAFTYVPERPDGLPGISERCWADVWELRCVSDGPHDEDCEGHYSTCNGEPAGELGLCAAHLEDYRRVSE